MSKEKVKVEKSTNIMKWIIIGCVTITILTGILSFTMSGSKSSHSSSAPVKQTEKMF
jgi:hypothetical protein